MNYEYHVHTELVKQKLKELREVPSFRYHKEKRVKSRNFAFKIPVMIKRLLGHSL